MNTSDSPPSLRPSPAAHSRAWRVARRLLLTLALTATLVVAFYTEENWRGKRAWEQCKRELEAKGEVLDWAAYIPAPVPDEQNIFKAPNMTEWFAKETPGSGHPNPLSALPGFGASGTGPRALADKTNSVLLAEVIVLHPDKSANAQSADAVLRLDAAAAPWQAGTLLRKALGSSSFGAANCVLVAQSLDQIRPAHLVVQTDLAPSQKGISDFILNAQIAPYLRVQTAGSNSFHVFLNSSCYAATDYLAWSDQAAADLDMIRKALERPLARIDGNYERPFQMPVTGFVAIRNVAQTLSQRAQCHLLLGHPEAALRELTLLHDLCRLLDAKPVTLVSVMIDVAVTGLYTSVVEDGLRLQAWREPQLAAIERQLKEVDLLPRLVAAFNGERAALCRTLEIAKLPRLAGPYDPENVGLRQRITGLWTLPFALVPLPRGWIDQNRATIAIWTQTVLAGFDLTNACIRPSPVNDLFGHVQSESVYSSPYTFLAPALIPNCLSATQTLARNQTLVNEALIACALDRYRLAHEQYPDNLAALMPQFLEKLPHDLIGDQPLKYRRIADGQFLLYSVGWNEKDDGGVPGKTVVDGDWAWQ